MSRRGTEKRRLAGQVLVRLTREQHALVAAHAEVDGVTVATLVRGMIAKALEIDPGPRTVRAPPEIILEIAHLRQVVVGLAAALLQADNSANDDGQTAERISFQDLISDVKAVVQEIDLLKKKLW